MFKVSVVDLYRFFLVSILMLLTCSVSGQELYMRIDESNKGAVNFISSNKIKTFVIFNEPKFLSGEYLDTNKLLKSLRNEFPSENASGYLVLNWEMEGIDVLTNQKSERKFKYYLSEYIRAIKLIKKHRPNLQCAFYSIPFPRWNENDRYYETKANKLAELIKIQDFIAPSLYILYSRDSRRTLEFIHYNMKYALKIAKTYDKSVYPFIWHRAHPLDKGYEWQLLPKDLFQSVVKEILSVDYNGKKADGIFWWHSENNGYSKQATISELRKVKNIDAYRYNIFNYYHKSIKYLLR